MEPTYRDQLIAYSKVKIADIYDGMSNTYAVGEKYVNPDYYENGMSWGDDNSMYCGHDWDIEMLHLRRSRLPERPLRVISAHPGPPRLHVYGHGERVGQAPPQQRLQHGVLRRIGPPISYSIEPDVHSCLGNRNDKQMIDAKMF